MSSRRVGDAGTASVAVARSRQLLEDAARAATPADRFRLAHLAALRATGALLDRSTDRTPRRPLNAWQLVRRRAPELAGWADAFAASAPRRAAIEAGIASAVSEDDARIQLQAARAFVSALQRYLDAQSGRPSLPLSS